MSASVLKSSIKKVNAQGIGVADDLLAVEEPLEIRLGYGETGRRVQKNISVTMRTPGNDAELAVGFIFTEGIIQNKKNILSVKHLSPGENIICIELNEALNFDFQKFERHFYTSSSCGVCGKSSIDAVKTVSGLQFPDSKLQVSVSLIHKLPIMLLEQQDVFESTGGLHASALFDTDGNLILIREDVGRHNALDKLVGAALNNDMIPLNNYILLLSGRASFELIQKAAMAGIKIVAAVGAPSSLAVELAKEFEMTLIGFLRDERFNIYCGEQRIKM